MKSFIIEENDKDQRLDKFLKKLLKNSSISLIYKLNRKGNIKVNKKKKKIDYKLELGDEIKIFLNDEEFEKLTKQKNIQTNNTQKKLKKEDIVYEDDELLVINKDSFLNVHPGDYKNKEVSLIELVQDYLGESYNSLTFKPSLVHRIDRETSGVIVIAKTKDTLTKMVSDFKNHEKIEKIYHCLVLGKLSRKSGTIKKKLLRIKDARDENKVKVSDKGLEAISHYELLNTYELNASKQKYLISEVKVKIETGRMHQIRVHLASLGNPILGDKKYGDKYINSYLEKNLSIDRQMLHAWEISFYHYKKKKNLNLKAFFKDDTKNLLKKLNKI